MIQSRFEAKIDLVVEAMIVRLIVSAVVGVVGRPLLCLGRE